MVTVSPDDTQ